MSLLADFSVQCRPKRSCTTTALRNVFAAIPDRFPRLILDDCLNEIERHAELSARVPPDHDAMCARNRPREPYVMVVLVVYCDGRAGSSIIGVDVERPGVTHEYLRGVLRSTLDISSDDTVWFAKMTRFGAEYSLTCMTEGVAHVADGLHVAYVVAPADRYAHVQIFAGNVLVCPTVLIPLSHPADDITFSAVDERRAVFDEALKPYFAAGHHTYLGRFRVKKEATVFYAHDAFREVHPYVITMEPYATNMFHAFRGFARDMPLRRIATSLWRAAYHERYIVCQRSWEHIREHVMQYRYDRDAITYSLTYDEADECMRVQIRGSPSNTTCYFPAHVLDPRGDVAHIYSVFAARFAGILGCPVLELTAVPCTEKAPHPPDIVIPMRPHQLESLAFMVSAERRETETMATRLFSRPMRGTTRPWVMYATFRRSVVATPMLRDDLRGGFLSDAMGLGKTCEILALCVTHRLDRATLVMCPPSLLHQWQSEIERFVQDGSLRVSVYHGKAKPANIATLPTDCDIVLITYSTYVTARKNPTFEALRWGRVVFDESHTISKTVAEHAPSAPYRWCVSATPEKHLALQLRALGFTSSATQTLNEFYHTRTTALAALMCRHDATTLPVPPASTTIYYVDMAPEERALYESVRTVVRTSFRETAPRGFAITNAVRALLAVCNGGTHSVHSLTHGLQRKRSVADDTSPPDDDLCAVCMDMFDDPTVTTCGHWFCRECITEALGRQNRCPMCRATQQKHQLRYTTPFVSAAHDDATTVTTTSKNAAVVHVLRKIKRADARAKILVFVAAVERLSGVAQAVRDAGFRVAIISGDVAVSHRASILHAFDTDESIEVCVLSLRVACSGLNMTAANHVVFVDATLNPEMVQQGIGRVHRHGQTRPVGVHHVVAKNTIEQTLVNCTSRPTSDRLSQWLLRDHVMHEG